jgi:hypothetical protein
MPRPDLALLGVSYRRIPVMAIGRDIYCDTRIQLAALDKLFPPTEKHPSITPIGPEATALRTLFEKYMVDGGLFAQGSRLMPPELPMLKDPKFQKDRKEFSGRSFSPEEMKKGRPEALTHVRNGFVVLEESILADGREWVLGAKGPTLADIEGRKLTLRKGERLMSPAIWLFHWISRLPGALDSDVISPKIFPKTYAWIERFDAAIKKAIKSSPKPTDLKGPAAAQAVLQASYVDIPKVDDPDPLRIKAGEVVEVWPIDSGSSGRDSGKLVGLDRGQIVIEKKCQDESEDVRLHFPRTIFRVRKLESSRL